MKRMLAVAAIGLVTLTGCGGGSKSTPSNALPSSTTSAAPSDSASSGPSSLAGLTSSECVEVAAQFSKASSVFSTADASTPYSDRFAAIAAALDAAADKIHKPDVAKAMKTLARIYGEVGDGLKGVNYKPGSGGTPPAGYLAAIRHFADPEFRTAGQTMSAYFQGGCH